MSWPQRIRANAWVPESGGLDSPLGERPASFVKRVGGPERQLFPGAPPPLEDATHPRVGWGMLLPLPDGLPAEQRARADDAGAPAARLLAHRQGVVLRYETEPWERARALVRYGADGTRHELSALSDVRGRGEAALPYYLLILADPETIPWDVEYAYQNACFVGRLDLDATGLDRYVSAVEADFQAEPYTRARTLVWSTDHATSDITHLMSQSVAGPLHERFAQDADIDSVRVDATDATWQRLADAAKASRPHLLVSTSHGLTAPLDDAARLLAALGTPVDADHRAAVPDALHGEHLLAGCCWYAHACCSAGSDRKTRYQGLLPTGSSVDQLVQAIARAGSSTAPLPRRLLGAERPIRGFLGHVEPTFDWTLENPLTGKHITGPIHEALYDELFRFKPIGLAFRGYRRRIADLWLAYDLEVDNVAAGAPAATAAALHLMARDRRSLVLLGDPAVALASPAG